MIPSTIWQWFLKFKLSTFFKRLAQLCLSWLHGPMPRPGIWPKGKGKRGTEMKVTAISYMAKTLSQLFSWQLGSDFLLFWLHVGTFTNYAPPASCPENVQRLSLVGLVLASIDGFLCRLDCLVHSEFTCQTGKLSDNGAVDAAFYYFFVFSSNVFLALICFTFKFILHFEVYNEIIIVIWPYESRVNEIRKMSL